MAESRSDLESLAVGTSRLDRIGGQGGASSLLLPLVRSGQFSVDRSFVGWDGGLRVVSMRVGGGGGGMMSSLRFPGKEGGGDGGGGRSLWCWWWWWWWW